eukprot:5589353-Prorocentrum_lima.AAC.1
MTSSLVGSEMCIRDRYNIMHLDDGTVAWVELHDGLPQGDPLAPAVFSDCLLYTSDAADDM